MSPLLQLTKPLSFSGARNLVSESGSLGSMNPAHNGTVEEKEWCSLFTCRLLFFWWQRPICSSTPVRKTCHKRILTACLISSVHAACLNSLQPLPYPACLEASSTSLLAAYVDQVHKGSHSSRQKVHSPFLPSLCSSNDIHHPPKLISIPATSAPNQGPQESLALEGRLQNLCQGSPPSAHLWGGSALQTDPPIELLHALRHPKHPPWPMARWW